MNVGEVSFRLAILAARLFTADPAASRKGATVKIQPQWRKNYSSPDISKLLTVIVTTQCTTILAADV